MSSHTDFTKHSSEAEPFASTDHLHLREYSSDTNPSYPKYSSYQDLPFSQGGRSLPRGFPDECVRDPNVNLNSNQYSSTIPRYVIIAPLCVSFTNIARVLLIYNDKEVSAGFTTFFALVNPNYPLDPISLRLIHRLHHPQQSRVHLIAVVMH